MFEEEALHSYELSSLVQVLTDHRSPIMEGFLYNRLLWIMLKHLPSPGIPLPPPPQSCEYSEGDCLVGLATRAHLDELRL